MKKLLLLCFAISAILFTSCEKEESTSTVDGYTLKITPSTATIGDDITLTISGDGAEDMIWVACFNRVDDGSGSCIAIPSTNGVIVVSTSALMFSAGEYKFYATSDDEETNYASVTFTE
ncbi:MAG: hypothetical protein SNI51_02745 [Rikenellaceae bacterium]